MMENTYYIREIKRIYADYLAETVRMQADQKVSEGLLGIGRGPGTSPAHDLFAERLEQVLDALAANSPSSSDAALILRFIYDTPLSHKDNQLAYWMLQAVHALTGNLIGALSKEDAAVLAAAYKEAYPRSTRLPAQKKIIEQLQVQAGDTSAPKKRSLLDILRGRD